MIIRSLLLLLLISSPAWAATKYVDNSGSPACDDDPGNGSEIAPWCTITYALTQISASDTLFVKAGTYAEDFTIGSSLAGSSGNPTIIQAFSGDTPTIGTLGNTGRVKILTTSWIVFDGFIVTDLNQGIFIEDSSEIIIQNNTVHNMGQEGIRVRSPISSSFNILIQDNEVYNTGTVSNGEGVYVGEGGAGDDTNNVTVLNNLIHDTTDEAIEFKPDSHDNIADGNTIYNCLHGFGSTVGCIEVNQTVSYASDPAHIIRNNIIYDSRTAIRAGTGCTIYNNVIYNLTASHNGVYVDNADSDSWTRVIYHNTIDLAAANAVNISAGTTDVKNNIGPTTTDNIATSSAYYFDPTNGDYHTVVGSTPVDSGLDLTSTVPTDLEGKTRPSVTPDVGAYELVDDWYAASCSVSDVQAAADESSDGHRVLLPPGNCTWSSKITITNKGISLIGSGIGSTNITNGFSSGDTLHIDLQSGDPTFIFTAIRYDGNDLDTSGNALMTLEGGGIDSFRVHDAEFINLNGSAILIDNLGLEVTGVIDNNTFHMGTGAGDKSIRIFGQFAAGRDPFDRGLELGSENFIFIEDNFFDYAAKEDGALDAFGGARYVYRYNNAPETLVGHHGADTGNLAGTHSFEIYENTFPRTEIGDIRALFFRSGTGVVFNNTWTGDYGSIDLANFRSRPEVHSPWGECAGASSWDENQSGESGYACLDQIGHVFTSSSGGSNTLDPLYLWSNSLDGSPITVAVSEVSMENHIEPNRDYYVEDVSFDGTSGVGVGLLSSRPSTCTPIVGYWATDESTLYRCNSTDTWTNYYTPFTYPHPLRGVEATTGAGTFGPIIIQGPVVFQ